MPLFSESEEKIFGDILFDIISNTNISRTSPGSKTRALSQAVSKKMSRMWGQFDINMVQSFLEGASGKFLDFIGDMMGVERLGDRPAAVSTTDQIVKFFVDVGTFGTINSGTPISVPAGTIISTLAGGEGIKYVMPFGVLLPSDSSELFISVEAMRPGSTSNVGSDTLTNHVHNGYTDFLNETLKITNNSEISFGRNLETDTNYKFRIANQVLASENANETAIRLSALIVPGVADILIERFNKGIGTFDIMIKATTPSVPIGLLDAVRESVAKVTSQGISGTIRSPDEIGMSLTATLSLRRVVSAAEESGLIRAVTDNIIAYINNLDIGEEFIVNEVVERVLSTSDLIKNVGSANQPLDQVFIYRPSSLEDNKVRETLITDFSPEVDEKLIIETKFAGITPILIRTVA